MPSALCPLPSSFHSIGLKSPSSWSLVAVALALATQLGCQGVDFEDDDGPNDDTSTAAFLEANPLYGVQLELLDGEAVVEKILPADTVAPAIYEMMEHGELLAGFALHAPVGSMQDGGVEVRFHFLAQANTRFEADFEGVTEASRYSPSSDMSADLPSPLELGLASIGATSVETFIATPDVAAIVPLGSVRSIGLRSDVKRIDTLGQPSKLTTGAVWDGTAMKSAAGMNTGVFRDHGYDGEYIGSVGRNLMAIVMDHNFSPNHPGFRDWYDYSSSRIAHAWDCNNNPCSSGISASTDSHGTICTGLLAGDYRDGQQDNFAQSAEWRTDRSGQAEEALLTLARTNSDLAIKRALDKVLEEGDMDVISSSFSFASDQNCNGRVTGNLHLAAAEMDSAGILWVTSAGNDGFSASCNLLGLPDALSIFTVGGVGESPYDCTDYPSDDPYLTYDISTFFSTGGVNVITRPKSSAHFFVKA